mmetsp:Transcript_41416/g.57633  ORF Transcript_41416/g.57633 Transcript_41416/m.57633 type:complete len:287 (+) Transcript_41416:1332-2192(+)
MDQLLAGVTRGDAIQGEFGQHALIAISPPQERDGIGEDLLCSHGHQLLRDALVLGTHSRCCGCSVVDLRPSCLGTVLAFRKIFGRPGEWQHAERLQLQELAELQQSRAGGGQVGSVDQNGVARLQLAAKLLQNRVGADDGWGQTDLLRRQLLQDLRRDSQQVILAACKQGSASSNRMSGGELGRLRKDQNCILWLQVFHPSSCLFNSADPGHAKANTGLLEISINHGVVHWYSKHSYQHLVMVNGLLQGPRFHLHLYGATHSLPVSIGLGRSQDVLNWPRVVDLRC